MSSKDLSSAALHEDDSDDEVSSNMNRHKSLLNGESDNDDEGSLGSLGEDIEELSLSGDPDQDLYTCAICENEYKMPRVLSCLHVFCEECLKPLLKEDSVACPTCKMATECDSVTELPLDYVMANTLDMKAIEGQTVTCTSCKAKEKAVARCSDCANFLCSNCVTAHQFMRCFENHRVIPFDEITKEDGVLPIHRPIICTVHSGEEQVMKYFCNTCQIPICNECMLNEHKQPGHQYERIGDIDKREMTLMMSMVDEAQNKISRCEEVSNHLQQSLTELESQRDDAKSLINETFQSYKALLEKRQKALLAQLEQLHEQQELSVMEMFHSINKIIENIEHACKFVNRIVCQSNCPELLSLKKVMSQRLRSLNKQSVVDKICVDIEFVTDSKKFEEVLEDNFGHFKLKDDSTMKKQQQLQGHQAQRHVQHSHQQHHQYYPTSSGLVRQQSSAIGENSELSMYTSPSPPHHLVASSSAATIASALGYPDMLLSGGGGHCPSNQMLGSPDSGLCTDHPLRPIRSHQDFTDSAFLPATSASSHSSCNLLSDQLGLRNVLSSGMLNDPLGQSASRQSQSPTVSDSGIGMDTISPNQAFNQSPFNLAALAKLGSVTMSPQGQLLVNNQPVPGLNVNNMTSLSQVLSNGIDLSSSSSPDQELHSSHSSGMFSPPPIGGSSNTGVIGGQRSSTSAGRTISGGGGGGSGFTSPSPTQSASGLPLPIRGKMTAMQIRAKFGQLGPGKGQFNSPHGFCMGLDEDIVVADTNNHRIQVFDKIGEFKYQFGIPGREEGQLWYPRKVAIMRGTGRYVICDRGNERSRMQIFTKNGHFVKKIAIRYIDIVAGLAITPQGNIVAVDSVSPTVFTISEGGDLIKWFDCSDYMREPSDIAVADNEYFVCDFKGHCVVVFNDDGQFQRRIGTDSITNFPNGIDISDAGDILVGDSHGNRFHVAVFQRDGSLIGEFECPYVKVSRCCGLKITSEGYVVTLAKNNHHVLVLNTLYIS